MDEKWYILIFRECIFFPPTDTLPVARDEWHLKPIRKPIKWFCRLLQNFVLFLFMYCWNSCDCFLRPASRHLGYWVLETYPLYQKMDEDRGACICGHNKPYVCLSECVSTSNVFFFALHVTENTSYEESGWNKLILCLWKHLLPQLTK